MSGPERFRQWAPRLLEAAEHADSRLLEYARQALSGLEHYDLPIGWKHIPDPLFPSTCWVAAFLYKLESPNYFMRDWRLRKTLRARWGNQLRDVVTRIEGVASWKGLELLGRKPVCRDRMSIQVVRLVASVRQFLRDDDNSAFAAKGLNDALKDVGLICDDRSEWFTPAPLLQDVSPVEGHPVTLIILRPRAAGERRIRAEAPARVLPDPVQPLRRGRRTPSTEAE